MGDHTETVQIEYDPSAVAYEALLAKFWGQHSPTRSNYSRQYMCAAFYHNKEQEEACNKAKDDIEKKLCKTVQTRILAAETFYDAEDYHQKYELGRFRHAIFDALRVDGESVPDLVDSHVLARLNGYLGGNGSAEDLEKEIDSFGLPAGLRNDILAAVWSKGGQHGACPYTK